PSTSSPAAATAASPTPPATSTTAATSAWPCASPSSASPPTPETPPSPPSAPAPSTACARSIRSTPSSSSSTRRWRTRRWHRSADGCLRLAVVVGHGRDGGAQPDLEPGAGRQIVDEAPLHRQPPRLLDAQLGRRRDADDPSHQDLPLPRDLEAVHGQP